MTDFDELHDLFPGNINDGPWAAVPASVQGRVREHLAKGADAA